MQKFSLHIKCLGYVLLLGFSLFGVFLTLLLADKFIQHNNSLDGRFVPGTRSIEAQINSFELYPYTGWHIQSNYHHLGDMPWERQNYKNYDVTTGDLGFIGFELKEAYPKANNEFRIILVGGSGAQGFGARTNEDMIYKLIPKYINNDLKDKCNINITLVNLAMAGSVTYQNFIALNKYGHQIMPDLILSYSGRNDMFVPFTVGGDAHHLFPPLGGLAIGAQTHESRGLIKWLSVTFPSLMESTNLGAGLRIATGLKEYSLEAQMRYGKKSKTWNEDRRAFFENTVKPAYRHALMSITRDFPGVPLVVAWQAVKDEELETAGFTSHFGSPKFYDDWFDQLSSELQGRAHFINSNKFMRGHSNVNTGTHLGNEGQKVLSQHLAENLIPLIKTYGKVSCAN